MDQFFLFYSSQNICAQFELFMKKRPGSPVIDMSNNFKIVYGV